MSYSIGHYCISYLSYRTGDAIREPTPMTLAEAEARKRFLIVNGLSAPNTVKIELLTE